MGHMGHPRILPTAMTANWERERERPPSSSKWFRFFHGADCGILFSRLKIREPFFSLDQLDICPGGPMDLTVDCG